MIPEYIFNPEFMELYLNQLICTDPRAYSLIINLWTNIQLYEVRVNEYKMELPDVQDYLAHVEELKEILATIIISFKLLIDLDEKAEKTLKDNLIYQGEQINRNIVQLLNLFKENGFGTGLLKVNPFSKKTSR